MSIPLFKIVLCIERRRETMIIYEFCMHVLAIKCPFGIFFNDSNQVLMCVLP